jgi:hypothetical protein
MGHLDEKEFTLRSRLLSATAALSQGFTLEDVKTCSDIRSIVLTSNTYGQVLEARQEGGGERAGFGAVRVTDSRSRSVSLPPSKPGCNSPPSSRAPS